MPASPNNPTRRYRTIAASPRRVWLVLGVSILIATSVSPARAADPPVTIERVAAESQQFFKWKITNGHTSPIVRLHIPQYHGDLFDAPPGWDQQWKNKAAVGGGEDAPGWVKTGVERPVQGIQPGRSAVFQLRIARVGAVSRPGTITVYFADGSEVAVAGVELPSAKSPLERHVMSIGLAVIFVLALLIHLHRQKKRVREAAAQAAAAEETE